ncbi:MAG: malonyl-ACP O-methyltransferase BioC [Sphingobacterium sp.]|jgi:malonyl-ACP O-methyltransferase BioC|nr:malonyl-ACP O-methyltransferase BioC [Sphingobacterium sp.]
MIDKKRMISRFSKAAINYHSTAIAQGRIAKNMIALLHRTKSIKADRVLEIGCGTGLASLLLLQRLFPKHIIFNDICPEMINQVTALVSQQQNLSKQTLKQHCLPQYSFICADAETCTLPEDLDLIISCSTLQWFADLGTFFKRCHSALQTGGMLAFSTFGKENMREVRATTQTGLNYLSKHELIAQLQALGYEVLVAQEELLKLTFESPLHVLSHLKQTGVTGIKNHHWTKTELRSYCAEYTKHYTVDTQVTLTYHPIYIIAKK